MTTNRRFAIVRHDLAAPSITPSSTLEGASWDLLRMLLLVSEHGSVRQASLHARVDHATVRTRIDQLESIVGEPLTRAPSPNQIELTEAARRLVQVARQMRNLIEGTKRLPHTDIVDERFVSIAVSEGIGSFWLVPQLTALMSTDPESHVAVTTLAASFQGVPAHNEIVVQLDRPLSLGNLHVEHIASLHVMPAASPSYVAAHGVPKSLAELKDHRFVWQYGDVTERVSLRALLDFDFLRQKATFLTQSSVAHYMAIADGCGIGLLPSYAEVIAPDAVRWIDLGGRIRRDIYMVAKATCFENGECARVAQWIRGAFDPKRFPWFGETFVDPAQFPKKTVFDADLKIRRDRR